MCPSFAMQTTRKTWARVVTVAAALVVIYVHASIRGSSRHGAISARDLSLEPIGGRLTKAPAWTEERKGGREERESLVQQRQLLSLRNRSPQLWGELADDDSSDDDVDNANCTHPLEQNNSCAFVQDNCGDDVQLFNYLEFVACTLPHVKVSSLGGVACTVIVSLLSSLTQSTFPPAISDSTPCNPHVLYLISMHLSILPTLPRLQLFLLHFTCPPPPPTADRLHHSRCLATLPHLTTGDNSETHCAKLTF